MLKRKLNQENNILENDTKYKKRMLSNIHFIYDNYKNLKYEGEMKDGLKDGIGILYNIRVKCISSNIYNYFTLKGFFANDKILYGRMFNSNNELIYSGQFNDNIPNGKGTVRIITIINNVHKKCFYDGIIKNFKPNGLGTVYDLNGKKICCVDYENNKLRIVNMTNKQNTNISDAHLLLSLRN